MQSKRYIANQEKILEQVGVAVITIDRSGLIIQTNQSALEMFDFTEEQMTGHNVSRLMPTHHATRHDTYLQHHLSTGEKRIIGKGRRVEGQRADGTLFPMHLAVGKIEVDGEVFFTGIIHDLSLEYQLQDQASRLGRIIEESVNEIFVFSTDSLVFSLVNRVASNNLGYTFDELKQLSLLDITTQFTENSFRAIVLPLTTKEVQHVSFQTVHQRKDGSQYDADVVVHLSDAMSPAEFVAIVQDSTERNQFLNVVGQAQKMESVGRLTGGIAHDFNNLLTVISGNLELLEMTIAGAEERELVEEAKTASRRAADLTQHLLSFARRSALKPERINLNDVLLEIVDLMQRTLNKDVSIKLHLATELWPVNVDRAQIDSAVMSFASNALDAMCDKGTLTLETANLTLTTRNAESKGLTAGHYVELAVKDTGIGIAEEDLQKIFEPFFTTKSKSRGHGLGLSVVYGFALQSGGTVSVESSVNKGSCFRLYLPRDNTNDRVIEPNNTDG